LVRLCACLCAWSAVTVPWETAAQTDTRSGNRSGAAAAAPSHCCDCTALLCCAHGRTSRAHVEQPLALARQCSRTQGCARGRTGRAHAGTGAAQRERQAGRGGGTNGGRGHTDSEERGGRLGERRCAAAAGSAQLPNRHSPRTGIAPAGRRAGEQMQMHDPTTTACTATRGWGKGGRNRRPGRRVPRA
jgi:hypothetical protein